MLSRAVSEVSILTSALARKERTLFASAALAALLIAFFLALHVLGLRDHVSFLSGTQPPSHFAVVAGVSYILAWFGAVLAAPVFAIDAVVYIVLTAVGRALARRHSRAP